LAGAGGPLIKKKTSLRRFLVLDARKTRRVMDLVVEGTRWRGNGAAPGRVRSQREKEKNHHGNT
jgi:hypothetical protein